MSSITSATPQSLKGRVRCTYEGCYRHFESEAQMRKHKAKDKVHDFYCKKCDEDCEDDTEFMIHQLSSPRHIPCPLCGKEFASRDGRDRHVSIDHRVKQDISCPGCQKHFDAASAMMAHIERNECKVISRDEFHKHRAEQQILKEALKSMEGSTFYGGSTQMSATDSEGGGVNLLDRDVRVSIDDDDEIARSGSVVASISPKPSRAGGQRGTISKRVGDLSLNNYPPLRAETRDKREIGKQDIPPATTDDLLDTSQRPPASVWSRNPQNQQTWQASQYQKDPTNKLDYDDPRSTVSTNLLGTQITRRPPSSIAGNLSTVSQSAAIPPAIRPNLQQLNQQVTTTPSRIRLSRNDIQQYWSPIEHKYICPGLRCGFKFASPAEFESHLLSGKHTGGTVQCPTCLKRFKTTTALIAHIESGSIKCDIKDTADFDLALREISAGLLGSASTGADGFTRYKSIAPEEW